MLRPLEPNRFRALAEDGLEDTVYIMVVKGRDLGRATETMIDGFVFCKPSYEGNYDTMFQIGLRSWACKEWYIQFIDHPYRPHSRLFTHLIIKPNPERLGVVDLYEDDEHLQTYDMFNRPDQRQALVKWLWNYGNDRLIRQAAIQARRKASRRQCKSQTHSSHPPTDSILHRSPRPQQFKTQASSKSKGKIISSNLGLASLSLTDVEGGGAREDKTLRERDLNWGLVTVSPTERSAGDMAEMKTESDDVPMTGAEEPFELCSKGLENNPVGIRPGLH